METTFMIKGTHCAACKMLIESVCDDIPGVHSTLVNHQTGITTIEHDETLDWAVVKKEIMALGDYEISMS